jgi:hypothetical protein
VTEQGAARDNGISPNVIDTFLESVGSAGMRTDDFMFYYADIFVEGV